jgi:hypothetical protein
MFDNTQEPTDLPLDTFQASDYLAYIGFPIAPATLSIRRVRGGGPVFRKFGRKVFYKKADLSAWAESRTSEPLKRTNSGG